MKTCKVIVLLVLLVSCWNCAEPELGIEEEILFDAELNLLPENVTVADYVPGIVRLHASIPKNTGLITAVAWLVWIASGNVAGMP